MRNDYSRRNLDCPSFRVHRAEDGGAPKLEGYAAIFNSVTDLGPFTESVSPGAFRESLSRKDDVRALFNHDANIVLGRTKSGTLSLNEDEHGLFVSIQPPDTQQARDILESISRGDVSQMSFGFYIENEELIRDENKKPHFKITQARLFDVSPVTYPAYEETEIAVKRDFDRRQAILRVEDGKPALTWRQRKAALLKLASLR